MKSGNGENEGSQPQTAEPRVLRDITLQWLSLDLYPGPYGLIPQVREPDD